MSGTPGSQLSYRRGWPFGCHGRQQVSGVSAAWIRAFRTTSAGVSRKVRAADSPLFDPATGAVTRAGRGTGVYRHAHPLAWVPGAVRAELFCIGFASPTAATRCQPQRCAAEPLSIGSSRLRGLGASP